MQSNELGSTSIQERIRALNDDMRQRMTGGRILVTAGISGLPPEDQAVILSRVCSFSDFTPNNDPWGEHDCGDFEHAGRDILWKIDYYDLEERWQSPDPSDPSVTKRVLTIMLAEEY
jgi:hypothetical protein